MWAAVSGWADMKGRMIRKLCLLAAAALLYAWGFRCAAAAAEEAGRTHVELEQGIGPAEAEAIFGLELEQETPVGFCFWGDMGKQSLSCEQTGESAQVNHVVLAGNPELMGTGALAWQKGCFLDEETALELFGTSQCGGQSVQWGGETYPVLGTVAALRRTILTMARTGDGAVLDRCVLALPLEQGTSEAEQFLMRHSLPGNVLDHSLLWALTGNLLLLFPAILLLSAARDLCGDWRKLSLPELLAGRQDRLLGKTLLGAALVLGTLWMVGSRIWIPPDLIPTRWSDFSFWETCLEKQKEDFLDLLFSARGDRQLQMLLNMVKSMVSAMGAALLALWILRRNYHADTADRG